MLNEVTLTILIIVIFVVVLLIQLKVLNTVAKRQYNIAEQMKEEGQDLHQPGPKVQS
jgi:archaellum component FlaG (FlaF/FlaG flagellin family)